MGLISVENFTAPFTKSKSTIVIVFIVVLFALARVSFLKGSKLQVQGNPTQVETPKQNSPNKLVGTSKVNLAPAETDILKDLTSNLPVEPTPIPQPSPDVGLADIEKALGMRE